MCVLVGTGGEIAQRLRALSALPEALSTIPSSHRAPHNHHVIWSDVLFLLADDIERYSKRYMKVYKEEWEPDWRRLPREMMPRKKCKKADPKSKAAKATSKGTTLMNSTDVLKKIEELERRGEGERSDEENDEKEGSKEKEKDEEEDGEEDAEQEEYDEEEQEEENDYINSYFDNGDDFVVDSDDNMDEATY
ncbi:DNA-directed RNA polymerase III subunit RPC7 isoform X2 [Rattus norvegicus]|uniref:DNA-directed RNA polymerase III subunit RPC7 isoform X2 n=1 Tax=Rattus norvegicus TaxID=10116 RepID=UPI002FD7F8F7